jgi:Cu/Zn superoxide dismutase
MKTQISILASALLAAVALPMALPLTLPAIAQDATITIAVIAQNDSGQSGTATLSADGDQTRVVIDLGNSPSGPQPAHIHTGTCANLGGIAYNLDFPRDGKSTSTVAAPLSALQSGNFAINVHRSPQEANVYVACGDIPSAAASTTTAQQPKPAASPAAAVPAVVTAVAKPVASPAVQIPAALPRTGDGSSVMPTVSAIAGALGLAGIVVGFAVRRRP